MPQQACVGEELELVEQSGARAFKLKGSNPPQYRELMIVQDRSIAIKGVIYTLDSRHRWVVRDGENHPFDLRPFLLPGLSFTIIS